MDGIFHTALVYPCVFVKTWHTDNCMYNGWENHTALVYPCVFVKTWHANNCMYNEWDT